MNALIKRILLTLALAAGITDGAMADESFNLPVLRLPFMNKAPVIDGEISAKEWNGADRMEGLCSHGGGVLTGGKAAFWVGSDGQKLYLAMSSETAPGGKIQARAFPVKNGNARSYNDDNIELIINPTPDAPADRRYFYHVIINARDAAYSQKLAAGSGGENWSGVVVSKSRIVGDRWQFECAIPLSGLGQNGIRDGKPFGLRICRNWMRTVEGPSQYGKVSQWAPFGGPHLSPETMPVLTFATTAPVVQHLQLVDDAAGKALLRLSVYNPGSQPLKVKAVMRMRPKSSAHSQLDEELTLAPGQTRTLDLSTPADAKEPIYALLQVASPDGKTIYYLRDFIFSVSRPEPLFLTSENDANRVAFNFAYYPSANSIKLKVDFSALEQKGQIKGVGVELRRKGQPQILAATEITDIRNFIARQERWQLPELAEGEYELTLTFNGARINPIKDTFVRHRMEWENNRIGMSDIIIPPFTPIKIDGDAVSVILRRHLLDKTGLWRQVETLGENILREPMRLELVSGGKTYRAEGIGLHWQTRRDTKAVAKGTWQAGPYHGGVTLEWDYDGLMTWKLELPPSDVKIDALRLLIPLKDDAMTLMHSCTDGIRFNYAGKVPSGNGIVWQSAKASRNLLAGTFVPYLWVGGEERGLAIAAENDKGWVNAPGQSCQEIIRRGDTLELAYHLIAQPTTIKAAREIKLAFQATPVKPMPENWRLKVFGAVKALPLIDKKNFIGFFGACYYWGAEMGCEDHYPRGGDMEYLRKLVERRDRGVADTAFVEKWLKGYDKVLAQIPNPEERKKMADLYHSHVGAAFYSMTKPMSFYTNSRGVRLDDPAGQTYVNEWVVSEFPPRKWRYASGVAYDLDPVESFRDFALWYLKQMAEICLDTVYWDNFFLVSNFNTTQTDAYYLPDGNIQPSMGIYNLREYARRTAVMYLEMKRPALNIAHMTNGAITPVLSMVQMNLTWEDKNGDADFQDRFSREYIRAESIGLQQGNIPFCLWLVSGRDKQKNIWADRTGVGVALTHEIKTNGGSDLFWRIYKYMLDFGYGKPEIKISQYWRKDHPVAFDGIDTSSLVMSKPSACLVLVSDWGNGGNAAMRVDRKLFPNAVKLKARDMETGRPLELAADGSFRFEIKRHDFKLILVEEDK